MQADRYSAEQAAELRDDWQYSRIFAAPAARPGFNALLALRVELQRLQAGTEEPGIAGMKFEWWRSELQRGFAGEAQHPVARSLGEHLPSAGSDAAYCEELVDAAETEYDLESTLNAQDFQLYLYRSGGVLAEQLAMLHGISEREPLDAARRLGQLKRLLELCATLHPMTKTGRWLFPLEWLDDSDPTALPDAPEGNLQGIAEQLFAEADRQRIDVRTRMEDVQLPPALMLQWSLAQRDYRWLRTFNFRQLLQIEPRDNALARLWTAWRGARAANRRKN